MVTIFCFDDVFYYFLDWLSYLGFVIVDFINYCYFGKGFRSEIQMEFCRIFGRFSGVRKFLEIMFYKLNWNFCFSNGL